MAEMYEQLFIKKAELSTGYPQLIHIDIIMWISFPHPMWKSPGMWKITLFMKDFTLLAR
jgi:hypothetical protein